MFNVVLKKGGFTLIDLLIVSMILGILGMIIAPQFHGVISERKLNGAAEKVICAMQYAQNLSVSYQRVFYFMAKETDNSFQVGDYRYKDDSNPHVEADPPVLKKGIVYHPLTKGEYDIDFDALSEFEGIQLTAAPADNYIYFYPDGHSSETQSTIMLRLGNKQRSIIVDGITGRITVQ